jgi:hypothetical protein
MSQDQNRETGSADPEKRAFTGSADAPPEQPDQPAEENEELLRPEEGAERQDQTPAADPNPHGDYTNLPGYGG